MKKSLYDIFAEKWLTCNSSIWIISDPHFGDVESYCFRHGIDPDEAEKVDPEKVKEFSLDLVKKINAKAGKNDTLIILGDIGDTEYVRRLKAGHKVLLLGNHDKGASNYRHRIEAIVSCTGEKRIAFPNTWDASYIRMHQSDFSSIKELKLFDEIYEGPLMISDKIILSHEPIPVPDYMFNIHGHIHNIHYKNNKNHLNTCAEAINYTPINLLQLIKEGLLHDIHTIHREVIDRRRTELKEGFVEKEEIVIDAGTPEGKSLLKDIKNPPEPNESLKKLLREADFLGEHYRELLSEYNKQKDWIEVQEDRINNVETTYARQKKILEIIVKKNVNVKRIKAYLKHCEPTLADYNNAFIQSEKLTQEEFDLVKNLIKNYIKE